MPDEREMTLAEHVFTLPIGHLARRQYHALIKAASDASEELSDWPGKHEPGTLEPLRKALNDATINLSDGSNEDEQDDCVD